MALRRLDPSDAAEYRHVRLEGLARDPGAFGAAWEDEAARPLPWFAERLERNAVFGGWTAEGGAAALAGVEGLLVPAERKLRHKGVLWGLYVRPSARRAGVASALVARIVEQALGSVEEIRLSVAASNEAAIRLYRSAGFEAFGVEPRALKVAGRYHDELLMALRLGGGGGSAA